MDVVESRLETKIVQIILVVAFRAVVCFHSGGIYVSRGGGGVLGENARRRRVPVTQHRGIPDVAARHRGVSNLVTHLG